MPRDGDAQVLASVAVDDPPELRQDLLTGGEGAVLASLLF